MTLIAAYNSEGCIGRCDAKCYNAVCHTCDCICGGMNHGVGKGKATENTQRYCEDWIENWKRKRPDDEVRTNKKVFQLELF